MQIDKQTLMDFPQRYRTQLINSLSGFKSANLIGSIDESGQTNLSIVSSVVHLGAHPPLVGLVMRPNTVPRHTFENIKNTGCYTINQVSQSFWQQAHQTSARYEKAQSEFAEVGLTAQFVDGIKAPFVLESRLKYSVKLREIIHLAVNNTEFVIGEIEHVLVEPEAVRADGFIDLQALETVAVSGLDSYHSTERLARLRYAKPDLASVELSLDGELSSPNSNIVT